MSAENNDDATRSYVAISTNEMVDHYRIIKKLGAGGMGEVYLAEDTRLKRQVALKFMPFQYASDQSLRERFTREAQAAAKLDHPNIVPVYEVGEYKGRPFFAMAHIEGQTLRDVIRQGNLSRIEAIIYAIQTCEGLSKAHSAGVVHRDIKPGNIIIDGDGRARLVDFGLAMIAGEDKLTKTGSTMGTFAYMSPEQATGSQIDKRSDIFSLGVVLYEMLTGQSPFKRENQNAMVKAIERDTPHPVARFAAGITDGLQRIIDKCLEKNRDMRYQHIDDLLVDLRQLRSEIDSGISKPLLKVAITHPILKPILIGSIVIASAVLVLATFFPGRWSTVLEWAGLRGATASRHLAVLPFSNIGTDNEAFCDGLLETLTSKVTQMEQYAGGLRVVPASDIRKIGVTCAREARKAFAVTHVVTGSVLHDGDSMRIIVGLADAKTERLIDSKEITGSQADHSALQDSTVMRLADLLEIHLQPEARNLLMAGGTKASEAYDFHLLGRGYLHRQESLENADTAIGFFYQALGKDQNYAQAYAGLSEAYMIKYQSREEQNWITLAEDNCRHALMLDDQLLEMHVIAGRIQNEFGQYEEAIQDFRRALDLDPTCHTACYGLAVAYNAINMMGLAEANYKKAIELKPDYWICYHDFLLFYLVQGRYDEAFAELDKVIELEPQGFDTWNNLGALYFMFDRPEDARIMWERSLGIEPTYIAYSNLGALNHWEGRFESAAEMYEKALEMHDNDYRVLGNLASACYWIPEKRDRADTAYQKAAEMAEEKLALNPRSCDVLTDLTEYYAAMGKYNEATTRAQQALEMAPENWDVLMRVGVAFEMLNERETAFQLLEKSLKCGGPAAYLDHIPELGEMRKDARYQQLLQVTPDPPPDTT